jgi:hypothetical protein
MQTPPSCLKPCTAWPWCSLVEGLALCHHLGTRPLDPSSVLDFWLPAENMFTLDFYCASRGLEPKFDQYGSLNSLYYVVVKIFFFFEELFLNNIVFSPPFCNVESVKNHKEILKKEH